MINFGYLEQLVSERTDAVCNPRTILKSKIDIGKLLSASIREGSKGFIRRVNINEVSHHCKSHWRTKKCLCDICRDCRSNETIYEIVGRISLVDGSNFVFRSSLYHDSSWNKFRSSCFTNIVR